MMYDRKAAREISIAVLRRYYKREKASQVEICDALRGMVSFPLLRRRKKVLFQLSEHLVAQVIRINTVAAYQNAFLTMFG